MLQGIDAVVGDVAGNLDAKAFEYFAYKKLVHQVVFGDQNADFFQEGNPSLSKRNRKRAV